MNWLSSQLFDWLSSPLEWCSLIAALLHSLICSIKANPKLELSPLQSSESGTVGGGGWVKRSELKPGIWKIQTKRDNFTLNQSNFPVGVTVWNSRSCPKWRLLYTNTSTWKNIFKFNWNWIRSLSSSRVKCIIEILRENSVYGVLLQSFLFRQQGGDQFQQQRAFHLAKDGWWGRVGWKLGRMTRRFSKGYTLVWK